MAVSDDNNYSNYSNNSHNELSGMRRDVHEAHTDSQVAKLLSTLALIGTIIALGLSMWALNKAGEAQSTANRATEISQGR